MRKHWKDFAALLMLASVGTVIGAVFLMALLSGTVIGAGFLMALLSPSDETLLRRFHAIRPKLEEVMKLVPSESHFVHIAPSWSEPKLPKTRRRCS